MRKWVYPLNKQKIPINRQESVCNALDCVAVVAAPSEILNQGLCKDLETECQKLSIIAFLGVLFFKREQKYIVRS